MASKMPRTLRIGPYRYELRVDDAAVLAYANTAGVSIGGYTDLPGHKIILASAGDSRAGVAHEILHVLADQSGLDVRLGTERMEDVCQSFDHGLVGVWGNEALTRFMTER